MSRSFPSFIIGHQSLQDRLRANSRGVVSGAVTAQFTYGPMRISQRRTATSYYGYDAGGSVHQLFDNTGTVTDTYAYDAFGNTVAQTGSTVNEFQYRGEQYDASLLIYYLRARYYHPQTGRFLTQDTDEGDDDDPVSLHKYLYADADPADGMDPSGNANFFENILKDPILFTVAVFTTGFATYDVVQGAKYNPTATDVACVLKKTGSALSNALLLAGVAPQAIFQSGICRLPIYFKGERRRTRPGGQPVKDGSKYPQGFRPDGKGGWQAWDPNKGWYPKGRGFETEGWKGGPTPIPQPPRPAPEPPTEPGTPPDEPGTPPTKPPSVP